MTRQPIAARAASQAAAGAALMQRLDLVDRHRPGEQEALQQRAPLLGEEARCASVSTPSATAVRPSARARARIAVDDRGGLAVLGHRRRNARSILSVPIGISRRRDSDE